MACAHLSRRKQARRCSIAHAGKFSDDVGKAQIEVALDVLEEDPFGAGLVDDPGDFGPKVPGIVTPPALSGDAERLAGIAGSDEMNAAAPWSAVEGSEIVPYKRLSQRLVFHPGHESSRRVGFPLDVTHSPVVGLSDVQPEIKSSISSAKGEPSEITGLGLMVGV